MNPEPTRSAAAAAGGGGGRAADLISSSGGGRHDDRIIIGGRDGDAAVSRRSSAADPSSGGPRSALPLPTAAAAASAAGGAFASPSPSVFDSDVYLLSLACFLVGTDRVAEAVRGGTRLLLDGEAEAASAEAEAAEGPRADPAKSAGQWPMWDLSCGGTKEVEGGGRRPATTAAEAAFYWESPVLCVERGWRLSESARRSNNGDGDGDSEEKAEREGELVVRLNATVCLRLFLPSTPGAGGDGDPSPPPPPPAPEVEITFGCLGSSGAYREQPSPLSSGRVRRQLEGELRLDLDPGSRTTSARAALHTHRALAALGEGRAGPIRLEPAPPDALAARLPYPGLGRGDRSCRLLFAAGPAPGHARLRREVLRGLWPGRADNHGGAGGGAGDGGAAMGADFDADRHVRPAAEAWNELVRACRRAERRRAYRPGPAKALSASASAVAAAAPAPAAAASSSLPLPAAGPAADRRWKQSPAPPAGGPPPNRAKKGPRYAGIGTDSDDSGSGAESDGRPAGRRGAAAADASSARPAEGSGARRWKRPKPLPPASGRRPNKDGRR
jgi:hypothetical protein